MLTPETPTGRKPCARCKGTRTVRVTVKGVRKLIPCPDCRGGGVAGGTGYPTK